MSKKAKEAAEWINEHPETSVEKLLKVMPEFKLDLHRRSWVSNFFKFLDPGLHENFLQIKPVTRITVGVDPIILSSINSKTDGIEAVINNALSLYLKTI